MSNPAATPHGPGMITAAGLSAVFVNSMPAAVSGDTCVCPEPGNSILKGSSTVFFGNKEAARQFDQTAHAPGGVVQYGSANVFIGG